MIGRFHATAAVYLLAATFSVPGTAAEDAAPEVVVEGAPEPLAENIRAHLSLADEGCEPGPRRLKLIRKKTDEEIIRAGRALGYYHMDFTREIETTEDCWRLNVRVTPGPPVIVSDVQITVEGDAGDDPAFDEYLAGAALKTGEQLHHGRYETFKSGLDSLAVERGYFDAVFKQSKLLIDTAANEAQIIIDYDSGPRYRFGDIGIEETALSESFVRRYFTFQPGDLYDNEKLREVQNRISGARYFSQVTLRPRIDAAADGQVPVHTALTLRKRHSYLFGIGAATDTGPRLTFGFEDRYLNDSGHRLNYDLKLSPIRSETRLNYTIPLEQPASESLNFYTGYADEETDTTSEKTALLGTSYTQLLRRDWLQTYFLNFQRETFEINDEVNRADLVIPGVRWSRTAADDRFYPRKGWHLSLRVSGASDDVLSDVSFAQAYLQSKFIYSLGPGRLLLRAEAGTTNINRFDALPTSLRFFAGGDASVRGYKYRSLGPTDEDGDVIGGSNLLVGSVEYDVRFARNWAFAVFYDEGNAYDESIDTRRGAGVGLRWISPIGPIRLDLASALDNDNDLRLHLSMGPDL